MRLLNPVSRSISGIVGLDFNPTNSIEAQQTLDQNDQNVFSTSRRIILEKAGGKQCAYCLLLFRRSWSRQP
jgi:hypothetical protein